MSDSDLKWFVVRTNPNCEARAVESLTAADIRVYCPMQLIERRSGRQRKRMEVTCPLFSRYLFVGLRSMFTPFGLVRKCDGVREFVAIHGEPTPVSWSSVEALINAEDMGLFDFRTSREAICLSVGDGVVLVSTIFDGVEASVERVPKTKKDSVLLTIGGKRFSASLDQIRKLA